jgi:DNA polymerase-3 subunit delta'
MTETSQNYLLKSLEEPPGYVIFALETRQPSGLLDTVRSRCRMLRADTGAGREQAEIFDPRTLFVPKAFSQEGAVDMAYWARAQYALTGRRDYLELWEASFQAFRHLEANGNADLGQEILWNAYQHVLQ